MPKKTAKPYEGMFSWHKGKQLYYCKRNGKQICAKTEEALWQKIQDIDNPPKITYKDVAKKWWAAKQDEVAELTIEGYKASYKRSIEMLGSYPIESITPPQINAIVQEMKAHRYAGKTIRCQHQLISMVFDYAIANSYCETNPSRLIKVPANLRKTKRSAPTSDVIEIIKQHRNDPDGLFPFFLLYTGCRRGEALALLWKDINWKENEINIDKEVVYVSGKITVKEPKTKSSIRTVPLLPFLAEMLKPLKKDDKSPIFANSDGCYLSESTMRRHWKKYCEQYGISVNRHELRHGYATILYESGIDAKTAQAFLGHADVQTTLNIYTDIQKQYKSDQYNKLFEAVKL